MPTRLLVEIFVVVVMAVGIFFAGYSTGGRHTQTKWDKEKLVQQANYIKSVEQARIVNEAVREENLTELKLAKEKYEKAIRTRMSTKSTGLRLPSSVCTPSAKELQAAKPASAGTTREYSLGRLPDKIEQSLRAIMDEANICLRRLTLLQEYERNRIMRGN